jgi:S1-C subfamily serine protease
LIGSQKPLIAFCLRYKKLTGDRRFEPEVKKRLNKLFPAGIEKAAITDFHGLPTDGVLIRQQSPLLAAADLRAGDVIVALNGTRTHTFNQYVYVRDSGDVSVLDLIVWQGTDYHEIKANPPNHIFGADFGDYRPQ